MGDTSLGQVEESCIRTVDYLEEQLLACIERIHVFIFWIEF